MATDKKQKPVEVNDSFGGAVQGMPSPAQQDAFRECQHPRQPTYTPDDWTNVPGLD